MRLLILVLFLIVSVKGILEEWHCDFDPENRNMIVPDANAEGEKILIRGGKVVNHDREFEADVYIENGKIKAVKKNLYVPDGVTIIDATGKLIMPGGIDPHTHLDMPFMGQVTIDDYFSGHSAALAGGTTMHIDFALPINGDLMAGYEEWRKKGEKGCMDYAFHMAVTTWNDKVAADMEKLVKEEGINSFKFFLAYKGALMVTDDEFAAGIMKCKELGAVPMVHAENGNLVAIGQRRIYEMGITGPEGHPLSRPFELEAEATGRAIRMAKFLNAPMYIVHVMSKAAMEEISQARRHGQRVIGEPVASGLAKDEREMWNRNFTVAAAHVMSPPIRKLAVDGMALRAALVGGDLQLVATDHCSFNSHQKAKGKDDFRIIPNGVNGIEERMHVVWELMVNSGLMTTSDYVRITSTAAAQIFNLYPAKGTILPGSDADIILMDPNQVHVISAATHHSNNDVNIYEGMQIKGKVVTTISRGRIVWHEGKLNVQPGTGRYTKAKPFGFLYNGMDVLEAKIRSDYNAPVKRDD